ncbi:MAG: hypothetical protein ABI370_13485 [Gammaproteobacteria bacterium]
MIIDNNIHTLRLLICLGIDIKSSIKRLKTKDISRNSVIRSIRECILGVDKINLPLKSAPSGINGLHNLIKFSIVQKNISPQLYKPCTQCFTDHDYSRVSSFTNYMMYLVRTNRNPILNPEIEDDIDEAEMDRYYKKFKARKKYNDLHVFKLGREDSWVFVASKSEIEKIGYSNTNLILDSLGFYTNSIKKGSKYVCIEYDPLFKENTFQPNALTGDWGNSNALPEFNGNEYFLSFHSNIEDWGRTYSVTGIVDPLKERVHQNFDYEGKISYKMDVINLDELNVNLGPATDDAIIKEALFRFSKS